MALFALCRFLPSAPQLTTIERFAVKTRRLDGCPTPSAQRPGPCPVPNLWLSSEAQRTARFACAALKMPLLLFMCRAAAVDDWSSLPSMPSSPILGHLGGGRSHQPKKHDEHPAAEKKQPGAEAGAEAVHRGSKAVPLLELPRFPDHNVKK